MASTKTPTEPVSIELRSYQVGFGDCYLLTFVYSDADRRHVLIDFGTTELPARGSPRKPAKPSEHMPKIAELIRSECEGKAGKLVAVVATHRHADHISGFGTDGKTGKSGLIIRALRPKLVIQPWTEDPLAAKDATHSTNDSARSAKGFVAGLSAMHAVAEAIVEMTQRPPAWMGVALTKELRFLGMDNIANRSAVENLAAMGSAPGAKALWARHGSKIALERLLPGVKLHVLGPPSLAQSERIRKQRSVDPDQFWHLYSGPLALGAQRPLVHGLHDGARQRRTPVPPEARWFKDKLEKLRGQQVLEIVRSLDAQMNNTSLILLFEVGNKKLLFPGDAQIENWSYALEDAPDSARTRELLAQVDLYKVGHHGSLNATPKELLWGNFRNRGAAGEKRLKTVLSTLHGKHGKTANETEVPRRPLLNALKQDTDLVMNTDDRSFGADATKMFGKISIKV
jgi:hypothetical protein